MLDLCHPQNLHALKICAYTVVCIVEITVIIFNHFTMFVCMCSVLTVYVHSNSVCWFVHGRIKEKISTIYTIKYHVYCMENTVQWSANTVQLF